MNYSGPIFGVCLIFVIVTWFIYGKNKWPGVNNEIVEIVKSRAEVHTHSA